MPQPRINYYDFGVIVVDGKTYRNDIIITPRRIVENWWRIEGHRMQVRDVWNYLAEEDLKGVDDVVIGTGYDGLMKVDDDVVRLFEDRGIRVHVMMSRPAVDEYNRLVDEGRKVILFIHLTC